MLSLPVRASASQLWYRTPKCCVGILLCVCAAILPRRGSHAWAPQCAIMKCYATNYWQLDVCDEANEVGWLSSMSQPLFSRKYDIGGASGSHSTTATIQLCTKTRYPFFERSTSSHTCISKMHTIINCATPIPPPTLTLKHTTHTHTRACAYQHIHTLTCTDTLVHTRSLSHTHTHARKYTQMHTNTHAHAETVREAIRRRAAKSPNPDAAPSMAVAAVQPLAPAVAAVAAPQRMDIQRSGRSSITPESWVMCTLLR
jgi:hypothetical protein